jgi:hypothetical protein
MSDTALRVDAPSVADHRQVPRGVLPRGMQTWVMLGVAVGMIAIILLAGRREPPARAVATAQPAAPNPERVRDYQERLRALDARAVQEATSASRPVAPASAPAVDDGPQVARPTDPIVADRKRRAYESLFSSNVVLSRRPDAQRPDSGSTASRSASVSGVRDPAAPSIDAIADAAVRASARASGIGSQAVISAPAAPAAAAQVARGQGGSGTAQRGISTDPISVAGPLHRILEGTVIDTVLTNRLIGGSSSRVCLVTNPVYSTAARSF